MEDLNNNYEQICIMLNKSFANGTISSIGKDFEEIVKNQSLNNMTVSSVFGYLLFWWTESYDNPGDNKSRTILKNAILTFQNFAPEIYPQVWHRLQETHRDLVMDLFPERF